MRLREAMCKVVGNFKDEAELSYTSIIPSSSYMHVQCVYEHKHQKMLVTHIHTHTHTQ